MENMGTTKSNSVSREDLEKASSAGNWPEETNTIGHLLEGRYSCRAYKSEAVPRAVIERMLSLAQLSASWCNSQPWQVIITEGEGTERFRKSYYEYAIADHAANGGIPTMEPDFSFPAAYRGIYKDRQREVGWQLYESVGVTYGDRAASGKQALENFRLFGAPHALIVTSERDLGTYGAIDCGLYMGSLLLAAQSLGLGMIPQAALATYAPFLREYFAIPDNRMVVFGASFGYPDPEHPANAFRSRRAPLDQVAQWVND
jgi:nitroreductase